LPIGTSMVMRARPSSEFWGRYHEVRQSIV
jgi:hypothetical protein